MYDGVSIVLIASSLAVAAWGGLTCALDRTAGRTHLVGGVVVELAALVQLVVGVVALAGGEPGEKLTFLGYLIGCVLLPPAAGLLALVERSRWGSAVVAAGGLILPVLVVRLQQVWEGTPGV